MSLYLGNDYLNEPMLVISKSIETESYIKNSNPSISNNFAIDTRRDLLFCDVVKILSPAVYRSYSNGGLTYYVYRILVDTAFIEVNGYRRISLYYINNFLYRANFNLVNELDKSVFGANSYYQGSNFIDIHTLYGSLSDLVLVSLRITENGISIPYEAISNRAIKVSNSEFTINNINYFSRNFLVTPPINLDDSVFKFGGKDIQIINSAGSAVPSTVVIDKSSVLIKNGSKTIIDSSASYFQLFMKNQAPSTNTFTVPGGFDSVTVDIATVSSTYKVLGITYYPRISIYPNMKTYGILVNSGTATDLELTYQDTFPVDRNGEIIDGFMSLGFYVENNVIKAQKIVEYDGDPIGVYPSISMRLDYVVVSEQ